MYPTLCLCFSPKIDHQEKHFLYRTIKEKTWSDLFFFILYRDEAVGDDLSELQSEAVPEEVRKWLASTFAKQETAPRRRGPDERPTFRSVANAIRTGIFIEKIYRLMSSSQLMAIPPDIHKALKVHQVFFKSQSSRFLRRPQKFDKIYQLIYLMMSGSCHLNRASNDKFSVECLF